MENEKTAPEAINPQFSSDPISQLAKYGAILSLSEAGLGSLLHAMHLPCRGAILSLNQIFLMTHALCQQKSSKFLPSSISTMGALGKSLAPCGKKLLPMLAITMQGLLYNLGTLSLGNNQFGRIVGAVLSSIWGWVQPLLFYSLIFGGSLWEALIKGSEKICQFLSLPSHFLVCLMIVFLLVKITLAVAIVICTPKITTSHFERYLSKVSTFETKKRNERPKKLSQIAWLSCKDLCQPIFLLSLGLTGLFFYFADSSPNWLVNGIARPLGFGFLSFFLLRLLPMDKISHWLKEKVWLKS